MSDDASLTDFAGGGDDDRSEDAADERDAGESSENAESAETPTYTYTSTPDGAECEACGEVVEDRWHAGEGGAAESPDLSPDALVCSNCKEW